MDNEKFDHRIYGFDLDYICPNCKRQYGSDCKFSFCLNCVPTFKLVKEEDEVEIC